MLANIFLWCAFIFAIAVLQIEKHKVRDRVPAPSFIPSRRRLTGHTTRHTHESRTQRDEREERKKS